MFDPFIVVSILAWVCLGALIWFVYAEGEFLLSFARTGWCLLIFCALGPFAILSFVFRWMHKA